MRNLTDRLLEAYRRGATEYDQCVALVDWMRLAKLTFIHVPNETSTTREGRDKLKWRLIKQARIGVQPEFPDYIIFNAPPVSIEVEHRRGVVIEMKRLGQRPTPGQFLWLERMRRLGYEAAWFDRGDRAIEFLKSLGFKGGDLQ